MMKEIGFYSSYDAADEGLELIQPNLCKAKSEQVYYNEKLETLGDRGLTFPQFCKIMGVVSPYHE